MKVTKREIRETAKILKNRFDDNYSYSDALFLEDGVISIVSQFQLERYAYENSDAKLIYVINKGDMKNTIKDISEFIESKVSLL